MQPWKIILLSAVTSVVASGLVFLGFNALPQPSQESPTVSTGSSLAANPQIPGLQEESDIVSVVSLTEPAVVSVIISKDVPIMEQYFEEGPFGFRIPRLRQRGTENRQVGGGTAFFVSSDGLLLTNKHVVNDTAAEYTVFLNDGRQLPATIVALDPTNDIAILKVEGSGFPFLQIASDDALQLGQTVVAIGNALAEFRNTVSVGVISGLQRNIVAGNPNSGETEQLRSIIQTDAAINSGNSGGPLLNRRGEVVGMNTAVAAAGQNIGFAIPAGDLRKSLASFNKHGRIVRPYIGIRYALITPDVKERNNLPYDYGVIVVRGDTEADLAVIPGSPGDKAGIRENDIILEADGVRLTLDNALADIVQRKVPGDQLQLKVVRAGQEMTVTVTLEEWKEPQSSSSSVSSL